MFPISFFCNEYFAPRYWPKVGEVAVEIGSSIGGTARTYSRLGGSARVVPLLGEETTTRARIGGTGDQR